MTYARRRGTLDGVRVIAGEYRGRPLRAARRGVRPTSDRVREAIFSALGELDGLSVLDLYAGSGALGIESLSRGAARVVFVERAKDALRTIRENLATLGIATAGEALDADASPPAVRVVSDACLRAIPALASAGERFDLVLVDPPYDKGEAQRCLDALSAGALLSAGAHVVVETAKREAELVTAPSLAPLSQRCYGDTRISRFVYGEGAQQ